MLFDILAVLSPQKGCKLVRQQKALWQGFLDRRVDQNTKVRTTLVRQLAPLLLQLPDELGAERQQAVDVMMKMLTDFDESVRAAVLEAVFEVYGAKSTLFNREELESVYSRRLDKKQVVRDAFITHAAQCYHKGTLAAEDWDFTLEDEQISQMDALARLVVRTFHVPNAESRCNILKAINQSVFSRNVSDDTLATRILRLWRKCDAQDKKGLEGCIIYQEKNRARLLACVEVAELDDVEDSDALQNAVAAFCQFLPERMRAKDLLMKLLQAKKATTFKDLKKCCSRKETYQSAVDAQKRLLTAYSSKANAFEAMQTILCVAAPFPVNTAVITAICQRLNDTLQDDDAVDDAIIGLAPACLHMVATRLPSVFDNSDLLAELADAMSSTPSSPILGVLPPISTMLRDNHAAIAKKCADQLVKQLVSSSSCSSQQQADLAVSAVTKLCDPSSASLAKVFKTYMQRLEVEGDNLLPALAVLARLAKEAPDLFGKNREKILQSFVVEDLLLTNQNPVHDEAEDVEEWTIEQSPELQAKLLGIKLIAAYFCGWKGESNQKQTLAVAEKYVAVLFNLVENNGEIVEDLSTPAADCARLRLGAARAIIQLLEQRVYHQLVTAERFQQLAWMMQDSCVEIRQQFWQSLKKGLFTTKALPPKYMCMLVLAAQDPEDSIRNTVYEAVQQYTQRLRTMYKNAVSNNQPLNNFKQPEYLLTDLVHLLAHHPDFLDAGTFKPGRALNEDQHTSLKTTQDYLDFFFDVLFSQKEKNFDFVSHLMSTQRVHADRQTPNNSGGMHVLCELANHKLMQRQATLGWERKDYPGKISISSAYIAVPTGGYYPMEPRYLPKGYGKSRNTTTISLNTSAEHKRSRELEMRVIPAAAKQSKQQTTPKRRRKKAATDKDTSSSRDVKTPSRRNASRSAKTNISSFYESDPEDFQGEDEANGSRILEDSLGAPAWKPAAKAATLVQSTPKASPKAMNTSTPVNNTGSSPGMSNVDDDTESAASTPAKKKAPAKKKMPRKKVSKKVVDEDTASDSSPAVQPKQRRSQASKTKAVAPKTKASGSSTPPSANKQSAPKRKNDTAGGQENQRPRSAEAQKQHSAAPLRTARARRGRAQKSQGSPGL